MDKAQLKSLKRLMQTLPETEAQRVAKALEKGEKTGYATIDRPWEQFYSGIKKNNIFLDTTPYQGLVIGNKDYPDEKAIEYYGANRTFG